MARVGFIADLGHVVWFLAVMAYLLTVGKRLLPARDTLSKQLRPDLDRTFVSELRVPAGSPVIGKSIGEANLNGGSGLQVLKLFRGEQQLTEPAHDTVLAAGDQLVIHGQVKDVVERICAAVEQAAA